MNARHDEPAGEGVLAGMRVLDFGIWRPAPYATRLLADLGADVLKVEPPGGDPMRAFPDLFATVAAHKRSVVLDLSQPPGRARALELARDADVVVEGYRPGVAERLGIDYESVRARNPAIVYCSLSGYGQEGPLAHAPGHDVNYQALAGVLTPNGGEPVPPHPPIPWADLASGLAASFAICAAWARCLRTGEGERVDVAMVDVLATWTGAAAGGTLAGASRPLESLASYGLFETADGGHVAVGITTEQHLWEKACDALGLADLTALGLEERVAAAGGVREQLAAACRARPRDDLVATLLAHGAPASPVLTRDEMLEVEQLRLRGTVTTGADGRRAMGHPVLFQRHPARPPARPPDPDEHRGEGFGPRPQGTMR